MKQHTFHGSATVGEKGQIVIPAEARAAFNIEKGEKLLVFGIGDDALFLAKPSHVEAFTKKLAEKLSSLNEVIGRK